MIHTSRSLKLSASTLLLCGLLLGDTKRYQDFRNYQLSGTPEAIESGDLDNDGIPDAVVATAGGVNVFLGRIDGSFGVPTFVGTSFSTALALGDFNGDGVIDIASTTASGSGTFITIALGKGDGKFDAPRVLSNPCTSCTLAAGDFDHNGKLDLAVANTSLIQILLGDGQGSFRLSPTTYPANFLLSVRSGDLNQDGVADLVVVDFGAHTAIVLLAKGDGTFTRANYPVGSSPFASAIADFNGDGTPDLAVNDRDANLVYVFLNTGSGAFGPSSRFAGGCTPYAPQGCTFKGLASGDFNHDGKIDLATPGSYLPGTGDGTFAAPEILMAGQFPEKVAVAVFPAGIAPALLIANSGATNFSALVFSALGESRQLTVPVGNGPVFVAHGDFDRDGKMDLAVALEQGTVKVLLGKGTGEFRSAPDLPIASTGALVVKDFNGDSILDIATGSSAGTSVFLGKGDGTFRLAGTYSVPGDCTPKAFTQVPNSCLVSGDVNGDGILDLIGANWIAQTVYALIGNGDGTFRSGTSFQTAGGSPLNLTLADFNQDGKLDLAIVEFSAGVFLLTGNGDGTFTQGTKIFSSSTPQFASTADLNGDGNLDLVIAGGQGSSTISYNVFFLPGNGNGTFGTPTAILADAAPNAVAIADLNGDGKLDVASVNYLGYDFSVITGKGDGTFDAQLLYGAGQAPSFILATDLTGTGTLDLITANQFSGNLTIALHRRR